MFGRACGCCCACNYAFFVVVVVVVAVFGCVYSFLLFFVVFCCFLSFLLYLSRDMIYIYALSYFCCSLLWFLLFHVSFFVFALPK